MLNVILLFFLNVKMRCLKQQAVPPIIAVTTERKVVSPNVKRKH